VEELGCTRCLLYATRRDFWAMALPAAVDAPLLRWIVDELWPA
jgi:hypothetical protein